MDGIKKSLGDYIMISPDEVPTIAELTDAASRLAKDGALLSRLRGSKDEDPKSLILVASFLESLISSYKKKLRK